MKVSRKRSMIPRSFIAFGLSNEEVPRGPGRTNPAAAPGRRTGADECQLPGE